MITINYLSHNRPNFSELTFYFLNKIKEENKSKITLNILATTECNWFEKIKLVDGIKVYIHIVNSANNYLDKLNIALNSGTEYSIKLDEDCFINNHIWDYIIENVSLLIDDNNLLISPIMSNNIPSCDLFINNAISDEIIRNKVHQFFLKRPMPNGLWQVNYEPLNKFTLEADNWDYEAFYNGVSELDSNIKGIHPLRISYEAQLEINNYISNNISIVKDKLDYSITEIKAPYFTNSLFCIKTKTWADIVRNRVDEFDEIALNNYKRKNNSKILFINNGFGLHLMYNTVFGNRNPWGIGVENGELYELDFYNTLIKQIIL